MKKETAVAVTATTVVAVAAATHLVSEDLEIIPAAVLSGSSSFYSSAETTAGPEAPAEMTAETETAAGSLLFCCFCAATDSETAAADSCKQKGGGYFLCPFLCLCLICSSLCSFLRTQSISNS